MNEIKSEKPLILIKNNIGFDDNSNYGLIEFTACTPISSFKSVVVKIIDPKVMKKFMKSPIEYGEYFKVNKGLDRMVGNLDKLREIIITDYEIIKVGEK